jgi:hypothetical protein
MRANALANRRSRRKGTCHCRFRFAYAAERQRAQCGKRATSKTRSAQEGAAIEAIGLPGQARRD